MRNLDSHDVHAAPEESPQHGASSRSGGITRRYGSTFLVVTVVLLVVAGVMALSGFLVTPSAGVGASVTPAGGSTPKSDSSGVVGEWVSDGPASFKIDAVRCDDQFETEASAPSLPYCLVSLNVKNSADETLNLSAAWQSLSFSEGRQYRPSHGSPQFQNYEREYFTVRHAFRLPLHTGKEMPAMLLFLSTPSTERPSSITFRSSGDSEGVVVEFRDCDFDDQLTC